MTGHGKVKALEEKKEWHYYFGKSVKKNRMLIFHQVAHDYEEQMSLSDSGEKIVEFEACGNMLRTVIK